MSFGLRMCDKDCLRVVRGARAPRTKLRFFGKFVSLETAFCLRLFLFPMLLNLSNHPVAQWSADQRAAAARDYGEVTDMAFPLVNPQWSGEEVRVCAEEYLRRIETLWGGQRQSVCVHLAGELVFCYHLAGMLRGAGYRVVCATSERMVEVDAEGNRVSRFRFVRFRAY